MSELLIIGNGFDLHCGLGTSYQDFFEEQCKDHDGPYYKALSCLAKIGKKRDSEAGFLSLIDFSEYFRLSDCFTVWDALFVLTEWLESGDPSNILFPQERKWRDVEQIMHSSLIDSTGLSWPSVLNCVFDESMGYEPEKSNYVLSEMIRRRYVNDGLPFNNNDADFFEFLFRQLHLFEQRFQIFIKKENQKPSYEENAKNLLFSLSDSPGTDQIIDSFNYSIIPGMGSIVRHLHGDVDDLYGVIFGITIDEKTIDDRPYLLQFTKSYRAAFDAHEISAGRYRNVTDIIFYGSSLGPQDDYYFTNIFRQLNVGRLDTIQRIVFAYSPGTHSEKSKRDVEIRKNAIDLIRRYGKKAMLNGVLDVLQIKGILQYKSI